MSDADYYADDPHYVVCGQCGEEPFSCRCSSEDTAEPVEEALETEVAQ